MATQTVQQEMPVSILIAQGALMVAIALAPIYAGYRFFFPRDVWDWIGTVLMLLGVFLVIAARRSLGPTFTIQTGVKLGTELKTKFPFNVSRNPMYVGGSIMCLAWSLLQRSYLAFVLSLALMFVLHVKVIIEERNLERVFGEAYLQYKRSVRRYF